MRGPLRRLLIALVAAVAALPATALLSAPTSAATVGAWEAPFDGEVPAINMALLSDGRVLYYSGVEANPADGDLDWTFLTATPLIARARIWDPATGLVTVPNPDDGAASDLFCSGTTILADGRVLAAGGSEWYTIPDTGLPVKGSKDTRFFDPASDAFDPGPSMAVRRWYPSVLALPGGGALVASGLKNLSDPSTHNSLVERLSGTAWTPVGAPPTAYGDVDMALMNLPMFPRLFVVPGGPLKGEVFYSTVGALWGPFGERPEEALWSLQQSLDVDAGTWTFHGPSALGARQHAAVVPLMLEAGDGYAPRLLTFGGTLQRSVVATPTAELADLSTSPPTNAVVAPMHYPRWHVNGVLGPDGGVYAIGGAVYDNVVVHGQEDPPILHAERYDPATGTWEVLAPMTIGRGYHSTAVLLPDGRILAGGHVPLANPFPAARATVNPPIAETFLEVFQPPYLFLDSAASRPAITLAAADEAVAYGETITLSVANLEKGLHSAVLIRPGATTHSYDADQRGIRLSASATAAGVQVTLPPDSDVAPQGWYMLFVNEDVGGEAFPSEAVFVHLS